MRFRGEMEGGAFGKCRWITKRTFTLQVVLVKRYPCTPPNPPPHLLLPPSPPNNPSSPHPLCFLPPPLRLHITVLVVGMERLRSSVPLAHDLACGRSVCGMLCKSAALGGDRC
ncbi:hypothetical protein ATANTOWER_008145 [Ataeniobius toweri]|uniref:Uncharacterized protein n=1 Tax=Ataeniobius toweri TaxID=208326 RepID=A0ABU7BHH2_9TELE|nr:hypothetical protein [Ataeniobius toweri]